MEGVDGNVAKDFYHAGLNGEVEGFGLDKGVAIVRFKKVGKRDIVLRWSWVVASQALVVEPWRLGFFSSRRAICSALV